ncbi:MAG: neurogenic locus notch [Legionellaceae bacterium]|nr:neurogenic locus notch [Legionellaceae bacterium]
MNTFKGTLFASVLLLGGPIPFAYAECNNCCEKAGGIRYCDSSAGRYVCNNGDYSVCYCTRHAVMDLQKIAGCCLWQGGVLKIDEGKGLIICNNGGVSEICGLQRPKEKSAIY